MSKTIVKYYSLTPKAWRHVLALEEYEKAKQKLAKLPDKEIMDLVQRKKEKNQR